MSREQRDFLALVDDHGATLLAMLRRDFAAMQVMRTMCFRKPRCACGVLRHPAAATKSVRLAEMTIGFRAFLDHHKRRHRHDPLVDPVDHRSQPPEAQAERSEWSERLNVAVSELPSDIAR